MPGAHYPEGETEVEPSKDKVPSFSDLARYLTSFNCSPS